MKLVSFSVDPDFDRPDVLRKYARANGADPARWTFLTGTRDGVRGLVRDGFKLPVGDQNDQTMPIYHSENFMIVDRGGRIRGAYDALADEGRKDLHAMLSAVVAEPAPTDVYVPADAGDPKWIAARRTDQAAAEKTIVAPHHFQFTDRLGASGITFKHGASVDIGKYYRAAHYDHGTAVAVADVDGDGLLDVYFVESGRQERALSQPGRRPLRGHHRPCGCRRRRPRLRGRVVRGHRQRRRSRSLRDLRARRQHPVPERRPR